jgi:hypothetical protein
MSEMRKVPAENFVATLAVNVDNKKVTNKQFREFVRNTLPIVQYSRPEDNDETIHRKG